MKIRRFLSILLVVVMCFATSTVAFAEEDTVENTYESISIARAGTEVWDNPVKTTCGTFTMTGNNLTPVKTIGVNSRILYIIIDSYSSNQPVYLTVQIRKAYTSVVLAEEVFGPSSSGENKILSTYIPYNTQIQINFIVTNASGEYISSLPCTITYSYLYEF